MGRERIGERLFVAEDRHVELANQGMAHLVERDVHEDVFRERRELRVGAAPTDLLGLAGRRAVVLVT
jgi:hypothetical protein